MVVPAYDVADYLPAALDSALSQSHQALEIVVVDDGSTDASGAIADAYARRDRRIHVVHTANQGLGAARNEGLQHVSGEYLAFLDSDDVLPANAYAVLLASLQRSGADFATGSIVRWDGDRLVEPPWMRRIHRPDRAAVTVEEHPEILGDVFAWNKLFRASFWGSAGLAWPEGIRYEDQPTTTDAFLRGRFDVRSEVVYRWRIRHDGSSITQQRSSLRDLEDRLETKRRSLASVEAHGSRDVREVFVDRVLAGDLPRYFAEIPGCSDEWWAMLHAGVLEFWGERSLTNSGLTPVHRLTGWLVEQDRRADAAAVMTYVASLGRPADRVQTSQGPRIDLPVIDPATVEPAALALRSYET
ncbi:MAG: glycosyl transferase, family 2 [Nocardioides sp.]|nr:glycosyl transferase, family 2 [Nocardioides sp.]